MQDSEFGPVEIYHHGYPVSNKAEFESLVSPERCPLSWLAICSALPSWGPHKVGVSKTGGKEGQGRYFLDNLSRKLLTLKVTLFGGLNGKYKCWRIEGTVF